MIKKSIFIFTLICASTAPINAADDHNNDDYRSETVLTRTTSSDAGSLLQFVNLDHEYIRALESEYKKQMEQAIQRGVDDFIYVNPKIRFLADMAILREQYEQVNNAWLRVFMEKAQASVQATDVLYGNPARSTYSARAHDREIKPLIQNMLAKVQEYVDQFNEVYQRYNWLLVYDQEQNKFILIDTVAPEYQNLLQRFAPRSRAATPVNQTTAATSQPRNRMMRGAVLPRIGESAYPRYVWPTQQ